VGSRPSAGVQLHNRNGASYARALFWPEPVLRLDLRTGWELGQIDFLVLIYSSEAVRQTWLIGIESC
jgi:hypothetical protein